MHTIYRVHYVQEIPDTAIVNGCIDMTQDHVETDHKGNVMTAVLDSGTDLTWRRITHWEKISTTD